MLGFLFILFKKCFILSNYSFRLTDKIVSKIVQKCRPYVLHLNVRHCWKITKQSFLSITGCRNIQDLNISDCKGLTVSFFKLY